MCESFAEKKQKRAKDGGKFPRKGRHLNWVKMLEANSSKPHDVATGGRTTVKDSHYYTSHGHGKLGKSNYDCPRYGLAKLFHRLCGVIFINNVARL